MRIIENYHHEYGAKKKSTSKAQYFLRASAILIIPFVATFFLSKNANNDTSAVLHESITVNSESSLTLEQSLDKNYDFSGIPMPDQGQTAFKVIGDSVWSSGTNNQAPMASITKVVTALAVLEKAPLALGEMGDELLLTTQDEQYYTDFLSKQGTVTGVTAGQSISQYHALQAILLASSNNIANTLADNYFGNQNDFVIYANSMLLRLGLEDTLVADASGFNPASVSTPLDLLKLGEYALSHPVIKEIVAQEEAFIMDNVRIPNYNALIGYDEITGIKPGFTDEAGYCLLFSAEFPNVDGEKEQFIAVVAGIQERGAYFNALRAVYDGAKDAIASQNGSL